jgi:hypothetical protein
LAFFELPGVVADGAATSPALHAMVIIKLNFRIARLPRFALKSQPGDIALRRWFRGILFDERR